MGGKALNRFDRDSMPLYIFPPNPAAETDRRAFRPREAVVIWPTVPLARNLLSGANPALSKPAE